MISFLMTTEIDKSLSCYKNQKKNLTLSDFRFISNSSGTSLPGSVVCSTRLFFNLSPNVSKLAFIRDESAITAGTLSSLFISLLSL